LIQSAERAVAEIRASSKDPLRKFAPAQLPIRKVGLAVMLLPLNEEIIALQLYIEKLEKFLDTLARNTSDINFKMQVENLLRENPYE
jgi:hypothetical protein